MTARNDRREDRPAVSRANREATTESHLNRTSILAADIRSDVLRRLVAHWHAIRHGRSMPRRADFDPLDVRFALGYLSLIQVESDPMRFYFRLDGTKQVDLFGLDCTRRYLDEAM